MRRKISLVLFLKTNIHQFLTLIRWQKAQDSGAFKDEIIPIPVKGKKGPESFSVDEHPRGNASIQELNKLPAVFKKGIFS